MSLKILRPLFGRHGESKRRFRRDAKLPPAGGAERRDLGPWTAMSNRKDFRYTGHPIYLGVSDSPGQSARDPRDDRRAHRTPYNANPDKSNTANSGHEGSPPTPSRETRSKSTLNTIPTTSTIGPQSTAPRNRATSDSRARPTLTENASNASLTMPNEATQSKEIRIRVLERQIPSTGIALDPKTKATKFGSTSAARPNSAEASQERNLIQASNWKGVNTNAAGLEACRATFLSKHLHCLSAFLRIVD